MQHSFLSWFRIGTLVAALSSPSAGADTLVHGVWVWKSSLVLKEPGSIQALLRFCQSAGINEVYVSTTGELTHESERRRIVSLIALLHHSQIRVESLLSSTDADEPGAPREKLLGKAADILLFNQSNPTTRFDGIHLDVEPQQRAENKGAGNLKFLPNLIDTYRAVQALARLARLPVNADIQSKLLKGDNNQRRMLLSALPRFTLMLYEVSRPDDGNDPEQKETKLIEEGRRYLDLAYAGLTEPNLAKMSIALRTADYDGLLGTILTALEKAFRFDPHYLGWARHSYNDTLQAAAER